MARVWELPLLVAVACSLVFPRTLASQQWGRSCPAPSYSRTVLASARAGHQRPLGTQRPSAGHIEIVDGTPDPVTFYRRFVRDRVPAMFRGAQSGAPALSNWVSDDYLTRTFGDLEVLYEAKREDRGLSPKRSKLQDFLAHYNERDMYVVTQTPVPMLPELHAPDCLLCGSFSESLEESNFWMSSGRTRSVLHHDADNVINCVISGRKDWLFIDPRYKDHLDFQTRLDAEASQASDYSDINVDRVDLLRHPQVARIPWQHAAVSAGDCVFVPYQYLHQVRSTGRTVAVSFMFLKETQYPFHSRGCPPPPPPTAGPGPEDAAVPQPPPRRGPPTTMDKVNLSWTFGGHGPVLMGYISPHVLRKDTLELFDAMSRGGSGTLGLTEATELVGTLAEIPGDVDSASSVQQMLDILNVTASRPLTREKIQEMTKEHFKRLALLMDPPHETEKQAEDASGDF